MPFMWGDTLASAERAHLIRLVAWGLACILIGTALIAWLLTGRRESALLRHFGIQTAAWGVACALVASVLLNMVTNGDLHAATRLDRLLWFSIGLDAGFMLVGATLIATGWKLGHKPGPTGAGIGVMIQGLALGILDMVFALQISR
jgi:hypothetical protein